MKKVLLLFAFILVLLSCKQEENEPIIAQVNGDKLTVKEFRAHFTDSQWNRLSDSDKKDYINDWINLTLFSQEADKLSLSNTPEIKAKIDNAVKNIKSNALLSYKLANINVTEEEMFTYYKLNKKKFQKKVTEYKIQRILIKDPTRLPFVRQELEDTSFSRCARKFSDEMLGKNGGNLGFVSQNDIDKNIWDQVTALKKNHYKTIKTKKGYYLIKWIKKRDKYRDIDFPIVKNKVRKLVLQQKREELFDNLIKELKKDAKISIEKI